VRRGSKIALVVAGFTLLCVLGVVVAAVVLGPSLPAAIGCRDAAQPTVGGVVSSPQRVKELFPKLGDIIAAHWQDREAVPRTCPEVAPMRYITTGIIVIQAKTLESYLWQPAEPPDVPPALAPWAPKSPQWTSSRAFDAAIGGTFTRDAASGTLFFVHNPV
jgi:hypothetical protein